MNNFSNVSDRDIEYAFTNTNFGHNNYRQLLEISVFEVLVGYHCGHTITKIMQELKLIGVRCKPTKKGKAFVAHAYADLMKNCG